MIGSHADVTTQVRARVQGITGLGAQILCGLVQAPSWGCVKEKGEVPSWQQLAWM